MRIKLNRSQLEGMFNLLALLITEEKPVGMRENLDHALTVRAYKKIRNQLECGNKVTGVNLTPEEAMGLCLFLTARGYDSETWRYEKMIANDVTAQIDRAYA